MPKKSIGYYKINFGGLSQKVVKLLVNYSIKKQEINATYQIKFLIRKG